MPNLLRMLSRRPPLASSAGAGLPALSDIWASPASPEPEARSPEPGALPRLFCRRKYAGLRVAHQAGLAWPGMARSV